MKLRDLVSAPWPLDRPHFGFLLNMNNTLQPATLRPVYGQGSKPANLEDAATPHFFRIRLSKQSEEIHWWVIEAGRVLNYRLGSTFQCFLITNRIEEARVFQAPAVQRRMDVLRRLYPDAVAEPATFQEWIDCGPDSDPIE